MQAARCPTDELSLSNCAVVNEKDYQSGQWVPLGLGSLNLLRFILETSKESPFFGKGKYLLYYPCQFRKWRWELYIVVMTTSNLATVHILHGALLEADFPSAGTGHRAHLAWLVVILLWSHLGHVWIPALTVTNWWPQIRTWSSLCPCVLIYKMGVWWGTAHSNETYFHQCPAC